MDVWTWWEEESGMNWEIRFGVNTPPCVKP